MQIKIQPDWLIPVYRPIFDSDKRCIVLYGGRDSGKSYAAAQLVVKWLLSEEAVRVVLLRKIYRDVRDSQFQTIIDVIEANGLIQLFKITTSPLKIVCLHNKNSLIARGLDKSAKMKSIANPTKIWYEEADEIGLAEFLKSGQSLRSNCGALLQELITFNPENEEENFISSMFFPAKSAYEQETGAFNLVASKRPDSLIIHSTYKDNPYCTPDRGANLESLKNYAPDLYRIYVLGLWGGALKGLIYDEFTTCRLFPEGCKWVCYGLDFGYTNDPSALVKVGLYEGKLYFQEIIYSTGLTNSDLAGLFKEHGITKSDEIICDSAEPKSIEELRRLGYNVKGAEKGPDSIRNGIGVIKRYPIVYLESSVYLLKERRKYKWKENLSIPDDQPGHFLNQPIDMFNHGHDALRYAVTYKIKAPNIKGAKARLPRSGFVGDDFLSKFL